MKDTINTGGSVMGLGGLGYALLDLPKTLQEEHGIFQNHKQASICE
jgi:hypothetical protein